MICLVLFVHINNDEYLSGIVFVGIWIVVLHKEIRLKKLRIKRKNNKKSNYVDKNIEGKILKLLTE